jgi:hypothetical protein
VFEKIVQRGILGPKKEEVMGVLRNLHNELHDGYSTTSVIRINKSRKMRWTGHVTRMGARR